MTSMCSVPLSGCPVGVTMPALIASPPTMPRWLAIHRSPSRSKAAVLRWAYGATAVGTRALRRVSGNRPTPCQHGHLQRRVRRRAKVRGPCVMTRGHCNAILPNLNLHICTMADTTELLSGTCRQLLFSPKGGIEGVLLAVKGRTLQVSMSADEGAVLARLTGAGKRLRLLASADHSPKTADAAHPVYRFESLADGAGHALDLPADQPDGSAIKGVVASLHFARHGQPNGVVLVSGEFIHMRPHGMAAVGLGVGAKVRAVGDERMTVLGTRMLEARQVNGIDLG